MFITKKELLILCSSATSVIAIAYILFFKDSLSLSSLFFLGGY